MKASAGSTIRRRVGEGLGRLRDGGWPILQTALAAALAWYVAGWIFESGNPIVAPVAAIISVGAAAGQTLQRSIELVFGVAFGIAIADLIVSLIGSGTIQIAIVAALAMGATLVVGGGPTLVTQAGISAVLVATFTPSTAGLPPDRFLEALIGGAAALLVSSLLPSDPEGRVKKAAQPIFRDLVEVYQETAAALREEDLDRAERALLKARSIDRRVSDLQDTLEAGFRIARYAPPRRRALDRLGYYSFATGKLDLAVRDTRTLARAAAALIREEKTPPHLLPKAILELAEAVENLSKYLENPIEPADVREPALRAAEYATSVLREHRDLETSVLVGQIRSTTVDLLRTSGMTFSEAVQTLREASRRDSETSHNEQDD
ncbi:MAG: FUSC family protein [Rubrobacteraceae bacterium]